MGFMDVAGKAGKALARGTASYLEGQSRSYSKRSDLYTDEQQQSLSEFADRMHGVRDYFSDTDDKY